MRSVLSFVGGLSTLAGALFCCTAAASILDTDFFCRNYGCLTINDGVATDIYDVYVFAGGGTVPVGSPLIPWTGNPIQGSGPVDIVETGSITVAAQNLPPSSQGTMLAIDINGNNIGDIFANDTNNNGYLDAADTLAPFSVNAATQITFADSLIRHSFYVAARNTRFDIRARATLPTATGDLAATLSPADIGFKASINPSGGDGVPGGYGQDATTNQFTVISGINDLGDLTGGFTPIAQCLRNNGTRRVRNNSNRVYRQSVRFDTTYSLPNLNLSMGKGDMRFQVEYAFYRR